MEEQKDLSLLEKLPQDLLGDILSRVAASSREDIRQCLTVSKTVSGAVEDYRVFRNLNLRPQAMLPLITYDRYQNLMARTMEHVNPARHYIEGIKTFFVQDNTDLGLYHLKKASQGFYDNGTYLYGILMMCTGNMAQGKLCLDSLGWKTNKRRGDRCWRANKIALRHIIVELKPEYSTNVNSIQPPPSCHVNDMDNRCPKCYHYKQARKFILYIG